jgi:folate-dependent phosphoribosylglycinamide formyltransferase PurN
MRVAVVTSDSFFSYLIISDLIMQRPKDVVSIVITPSRVKGKSMFGSIVYVLKKSGWRNLIYKIVSALWIYFAEALYKLGFVPHCITPSNIANLYGIDLHHSEDCNDERTLTYLRSKEIDILLSINVYQRMLEPILSLPKIAAVNNHFGLLPKYRGMAPYMWAMANGEEEIGLSIHHMVIEFDKGKLIHQEKMSLRPKDSAMGVYIRACMIARKSITKVVAELEENPKVGFEQTGEGSYFSVPTRQCIRELRRRGYYLWRIKDLLLVLCKKLDGQFLP